MKRTKNIGKDSKPKSRKRAKLDFAQRLAEKLRLMKKGTVDEGELSDKSARWVALQYGTMKFEVIFDHKGENICYVGVWENVYEKVDEKVIFKV